jgi:hypothetical protein
LNTLRKLFTLQVTLTALIVLAMTGYLSNKEMYIFLVFILTTTVMLNLWWLGMRSVWHALRYRHYSHLISLVALLLGMLIYTLGSLWFLRPDLFPQQGYYNFIANRHVTERLVDPDLLKVEEWEMMGETREVLFVHPTASGNTTLVYPVKVKPRTTLQAHLAVAPEAWTAEGDGVTFSVYVEDRAGIHLVYSQYIDPKHHEQDRRWVPMQVDLTPFTGKLVRMILVVGSGPAGDTRYDWAGWGNPSLNQPVWPWNNGGIRNHK